MPILDNPKHEAFARELAKGSSQAESYASAGYRPSDQHASRLASDGKVLARVAELTARITDAVMLTREWVLERLIANANAAMEERDGNVANRALELLGKELGMFVDRSEHTLKNYDISDKPGPTIEEWQDKHVTSH